MKLEAHQSERERSRWKLVKTDDCTDIKGEINWVDPDTGSFSVMEPSFDSQGYPVVNSAGIRQFKPTEYHWAPGSFRVVRRR